MKKLIGMLILAMLPVGVSAVPITYDFNLPIQTGGVTGTLTTDGTLGSLLTANITAYDLTFDDGVDSFFLTEATSTLTSNGLLTATATDLFLDFSNLGRDFRIFFEDLTMGVDWLLDAAENESGTVPGGSYSLRHSFDDGRDRHAISVGGNALGQVSAGTVATSVPEPGILGLLCLSLVGLAIVRRNRI